MSTFETTITNPKKQLEFYEQLTKQLQQENQQLKMIIKEYERLDNGESRGCTITRVDEYDIYDLIKCKDNWNKLKEWVKMEHREDAIVINLTWKHATSKFLDKMQELERGVSNE